METTPETINLGQNLPIKTAIFRGSARALPVVMGYIPVGFAFGVLAQKASLTLWQALAMSIFVYAGSAQLIAVGLIASGAAIWPIILTTFVVNLRHMLMSAALSPYLKRWRPPQIAGFTYELTDETFAVHSVRFAEAPPPTQWEALATNVTSQLSWVLGTWLGVVAGGLISDVKPFGLDYALIAMFIALLMMQVKNKVHVIVAITGGLLSLAFWKIGFGSWNVIAATLIAATVGVWVESWTKKTS